MGIRMKPRTGGDLTGTSKKEQKARAARYGANANARVQLSLEQQSNGFRGKSLNDDGLPDGRQSRDIERSATTGAKSRAQGNRGLDQYAGGSRGVKSNGDLKNPSKKDQKARLAAYGDKANARVAISLRQQSNGFQGESLNDHGLPDGHVQVESAKTASEPGAKFRQAKRPAYKQGTRRVGGDLNPKPRKAQAMPASVAPLQERTQFEKLKKNDHGLPLGTSHLPASEPRRNVYGAKYKNGTCGVKMGKPKYANGTTSVKASDPVTIEKDEPKIKPNLDLLPKAETPKLKVAAPALKDPGTAPKQRLVKGGTEAVAKWQKKLGVTVDGAWGKETQAAYEKWQASQKDTSSKKSSYSAPPAIANFQPASNQRYERGSASEAVLQEMSYPSATDMGVRQLRSKKTGKAAARKPGQGEWWK